MSHRRRMGPGQGQSLSSLSLSPFEDTRRMVVGSVTGVDVFASCLLFAVVYEGMI